jgi:cytochrome oxidase Cu insertion factor (SCO1/SenC/PrrC family)
MRGKIALVGAMAIVGAGCLKTSVRAPATFPVAETSPAVDPVLGRPAPEIVGEDVDGIPFRLSDYRGKVVVLDFWGHW